jgi:hypothetical protein
MRPSRTISLRFIPERMKSFEPRPRLVLPAYARMEEKAGGIFRAGRHTRSRGIILPLIVVVLNVTCVWRPATDRRVASRVKPT